MKKMLKATCIDLDKAEGDYIEECLIKAGFTVTHNDTKNDDKPVIRRLSAKYVDV